MSKKLALIFSFLISFGVVAEDTPLVPNDDIVDCAISKSCELTFKASGLNKQTSYNAYLFNSNDLDLEAAISVVLKKYDHGAPFVAGIVFESVDVDTDNAVQTAPKVNVYTTYANPDIEKEAEIVVDWFSTTMTASSIADPGERPDSKPPPPCPPRCNNAFSFVPADQYLPSYGDPLKEIMAVDSLIPVFVPLQ